MVMAQHGLSPQEHLFVFIDGEGLNSLDQAGFYRTILEETEEQLLERGFETQPPAVEPLTYRQFERRLRQFNRQGFKLIYIFDEFELLSLNHHLDADFFSGLRGLTGRHDICYVTASQTHLLELSYAEGVLGSPFFNIFAVQHLGLFSPPEARQLIHQPAAVAGLPFAEAAGELILNLVGPHPLFLNIACFHTFAWLQSGLQSYQHEADKQFDLTEAGSQIVQSKVLAEMEGHFRYYWSKLDQHERQALINLGQAGQGETTRVLMHRLEQQGLIVRDNGGYRYLSMALADFVARQAAEGQGIGLPTEPGHLGVGSRLGQYVITDQLGQGGMAWVYKGRHQALQRDVAIKILLTHLADDETALARFHREAQAVAGLRHPHIVQVYDFGMIEDCYYMVMEYINGGSLKDRLAALTATGDLMPLDEVVRLIREVAAALDYAHVRGIIHRDLKPANIMLTAAGQAVLADFGLVRLMGGPCYTATGASWGTPAYMSPEQAQGERGDARSDIYSLGVILYELTTGHLPFESDTPFALMMKHVTEPVKPPCSLNVHLPAAIEPVILKALAKPPEARYSSAGQLAQALSLALASTPICPKF
jgi:serine/threonine-protein kinase